MATFDYTRSVKTATRLITNFGQNMVLRVDTKGAYDPATGESPVTSVDNDVIGVIFELTRQPIGENFQQDMLVLANHKQCLLTVGISPNVSDKLVVGVVTYSIVTVKELNPGGTVIFYDLVLRNG